MTTKDNLKKRKITLDLLELKLLFYNLYKETTYHLMWILAYCLEIGLFIVGYRGGNKQ